ncbi:hypothetical protein BCT46_03370 [Vibrio sp. 10N.261.46.E8]|mgnify:FL=1|nr:hypothetical protein BCU27_25240 [Vibrio sp. 10N.286.45.B6]PMM90623.1 hypothetical protein BCT46_03370 [Vibrio sp. 10N.261.46.E8]PMN78836.1 hypothetical protein BCT25_17365 [Vibrio sp. 10N.261.45.A6]
MSITSKSVRGDSEGVESGEAGGRIHSKEGTHIVLKTIRTVESEPDLKLKKALKDKLEYFKSLGADN